MAATDSRIRSDLLTMVFRSDYSWLTARLRYKLGCRYNAEDVASEAFTQLAAMPTLAYMEALALAPEACHPSPEEQHLLMESLLAVDKALEGLSVNARSAFLYSQLDGLTYAQIGELLGVSAARVRQYMVKALRCCYEAARHEQGI